MDASPPHISICGECWRTGDVLTVQGRTMTVERLDRLRFASRGRSVVVEAVNPMIYKDREIYAAAVRIVEGAEPVEWPASGVAWRGNAVGLAIAALNGSLDAGDGDD